MIKFQKKSYIIFAVLSVLLTMVSLWAAKENATSYALVPLLSWLILIALLIAFSQAKEEWFSEHFKWEELRTAILVVLVINLMSSALLLIASEASHIDNTLDGINLFRLSLLAGAPVGVMFWIKLSKIFDKKSIVMLKMFLISFALITATAASQLNRKSAGSEELPMVIDVLRKEQGGVGVASYLMQVEPPLFIFFQNHNDEEERLVAPEAVWNVTFNNATMNLSIKEGYLGYHYVLRFGGRVLEQ
ncbi:MAG: hypothetical protein L3J28_07930 [Candidatus Polarisedimenticolaceae bacterium]|nr:hypothetical protein [Candidatus Polarisedimenticolaceae bacterium]